MNLLFPKSLALFTVGAGMISCHSFQKESPRPNILFIMSDDHTQRAISAYDDNLLQTPNIDRLAKEGAIFRSSFVTNSICAPSRAVLLTGKYSHLNGKVDNVSKFNWDQPSFPKLMQQHGYQTALIGKIHLEGLPQGFDYSIVLPGQGDYYNPVFLENGERKQFEGHCTPLTTQFTLDWLENKRDKSKPFCVLYHQKAPHRNWLPETKYLDYLEDVEFEFPDNFFDDYEGRGSAALQQEMEIVGHMGWGHDMKFENDPYTGEPTNFMRDINRMNDEQRAAWRAAYNPRNEAFLKEMPEGRELAKFKFHRYLRDYLKTIKSIDDGVGEVLAYLEKNGLLENTIVIYTSDQGFYLGEHGWFDKRFMYEQSLSTPLLVRYPREIKPGTEVLEMVQNIDLAPTLLDYAGIEAPADMQGLSFRKLVAGKKVDWRDAIYYHYYEYPSVHMVKRHYGVRTDRYKLIHFYYDVDEWEMYDLQADPSEMKSIYGDPEYAEVQAMLEKRLAGLRLQYGDSDESAQKYLKDYLSTRQ
jgi:arylsulfatase A-like enzyme